MPSAPSPPDLPRFLSLSALLACACAGPRLGAAEKAGRIVRIENDQSLADDRRVVHEFKEADGFSDRDLSTDVLRAYPPESLRLILTALDDVAFYSHGDPAYVDREAKVFDELSARRVQTKDDVEKMFQRELSARHFERAAELKRRFPEVVLWDVPTIVDESRGATGAYAVYDISADAKTASIKSLAIGSGPKIVVAAFGGCPVTARAMKYARSDARITDALRSLGILLTVRFEPDGVALLNSQGLPMRAYVARSQKDWPAIDFSRSPTFYFLKDGKVVYQFVGWGPDSESAKDFQQGLARIGAGKS